MNEIIQAIHQALEGTYHGLTWRLWQDKQLREGQAQIDIDHHLLQLCHQGKIPAVIRLWQNHPCLVLSRRDRQQHGFEAAETYFKQKNIPLYVRSSGGTVVPHGPDVLNISLVFSTNDQMTIDKSYNILCGYVQGALGEMGIIAEVNDVTGAFCDGRFNLTIGGQKVGGTAQRIKRHQGGQKTILSHMCLLVSGNVEVMTEEISGFYRLCGVNYQIKSEAVTTVAHNIKRKVNDVNLSAEIRKNLAGMVEDHRQIEML